jgi:hypothetical protein
MNGGSKLTDHAQVREFGVERSPTKSGKLDVAVVHLARSRVQNLSEDEEKEKRCQIKQLHRRRNEAEEDEVGDVEVRGFWQILGQKIHCR